MTNLTVEDLYNSDCSPLSEVNKTFNYFAIKNIGI